MTSTVVSETMRKLADTPPTLADVTVASPVPVTVTTAPGVALDGVKPVTVAEPPPATVGLGDSCVAVGAAASPPPPPQPAASASIAQAPRRPTLQEDASKIGCWKQRHGGQSYPRVRVL